MNTIRTGFHIPLQFGEEQIKEFGAKLLGSGLYQAIEIKYPYEIIGFDPSSYLRGIESIIHDYIPLVSMHIPANYDLGIWNVGVRKEILKQCKNAINFAWGFNATVLPIHPGTIGTMDIPQKRETPYEELLFTVVDKKKEMAKALTIEALKELSDYAAQHEMILAVENLILPHEIGQTPQELLSIVQEAAQENLKILVDVGHAHRYGIAPDEFIREIGSALIHIHLTDNDGTCDLHLNLGKGSIDFEKIFKALDEINYTGVVIVESAYEQADELFQNHDVIKASQRNHFAH